MTESTHERLRHLFDRALDLQSSARTKFLDEKCGDDALLKQRLIAMLSAAESEQFLSAPTGAVPIDIARSPFAAANESPGSQIGPYKLLERIGEGGFGSVFLAEQEKPVARKVALKIIKLGMDTRQVVARFEQERQALAMMDHPNIARVIDAGATDTGRPYFVMELVQGDPIAEYCDKHNLTIDERLALFAQVCAAVQHAHSKGIIHRDIKPSNVLVATEDGRPHAKVIDFGIAKATSAKLTDKTLFTEIHQVIGTLKYMSPEQAEGSLDVDTRTDVYSLGVMLYELLTGTTPFDETTFKGAMFGEIQRMIREVEPPRPSTRLTQSADSLASVAARRRVEPRRLGAIIRGELDWVVMKALEKDRARRYETASAFALDISNYLSGGAVSAAPPSASYRVRKFVRRNRGVVAAAAAVAVALLVGAIGFAWQASIAGAERDNAVKSQLAEAAQRRVADEQKARAQEQEGLAEANAAAAAKARDQMQRVAEFQARMLRRVPPYEMGRDLALDLSARVRDAQKSLDLTDDQRARALSTFGGLLDGISMTDVARRIIDANVLTPSAESIAKEFGDEPLIQASLHHTVAAIYRDLGIFDKAKLEAQREFNLRTANQGPDDRDTLRAKADIGHLCESLGQPEESKRILEDVTPQLERALGVEDPDALRSRMCLGVIAIEQGHNDEARAIFEKVLAVQERTLGPDHEDVAMTLGNLGMALTNLKKPDEAAPLFERALSIRRHKWGADDASTLEAQQHLASAYEDQRRFDDAYRLRLDAIETLARIRGASHPATITAIAQLADLYKKQNRFEEAEVQARRALALRRTALGDAHPLTIDSIDDVAILCTRLGRFDEAEKLFLEAVERATETFGRDAAKTMTQVNNLAVAYWYEGKLAEVEPLFDRALDFARRTYGENDPNTAFAMNNVAILMHRLGRIDEERPLVEHALAIYRAAYGEDHQSTLEVKSTLAVLLFDSGELGPAESMFRELIETQTRALGENSPNTLETKNNLSTLLVKSKRYDEAETLLVDVLERRRKSVGADNPETLLSLHDLISLYVETDRLEKARPLLEELVAARKRAAAEPDASPRALEECASILIESPIAELRDPKLALEYARRASTLNGETLPQCLQTLARALDANADVEGAIETMKKALALLPKSAPDRAKFEERLKEFETARDKR